MIASVLAPMIRDLDRTPLSYTSKFIKAAATKGRAGKAYWEEVEGACL